MAARHFALIIGHEFGLGLDHDLDETGHAHRDAAYVVPDFAVFTDLSSRFTCHDLVS